MMEKKNQINDILEMSKTTPVLLVGGFQKSFKNAIVLDANIPSKDLGAVATRSGIETPMWFQNLVNDKNNT